VVGVVECQHQARYAVAGQRGCPGGNRRHPPTTENRPLRMNPPPPGAPASLPASALQGTRLVPAGMLALPGSSPRRSSQTNRPLFVDLLPVRSAGFGLPRHRPKSGRLPDRFKAHTNNNSQTCRRKTR
jgi:hypothetical protein